MTAKSSSDRSKNKEDAPKIPMIEWVVGALGLALVSGAIGLLIYEGLSAAPSPPDIHVSAHTVSTQRNGHVALINVYNQGGEPASRVAISGDLVEPSQQGVVESASTEIEFLPAKSQREAGMFFTRDPKSFELRLRALGYEKP
ncbi:hypothetical protein FEM03_02495 [Phragmitibacter flavus]|uniref:TIGR02588 family protein n=1 Tax=Phragmitibacter flavus TaxID=2576071 RepID=A0A5R8KIU0_9BACT|nr:hypothetical protein [Phragmitibacter flavus]TLD72246.1 hypothetical protein FEM03_02495 [Phragmitibacter flavus]